MRPATARPPGSTSLPAGTSIRFGLPPPRGTAKIAPSVLGPAGGNSESWSISSTYSVPSGPKSRSIALVKPDAYVVYLPVRGLTRKIFAPPIGNGKPVSWLT